MREPYSEKVVMPDDRFKIKSFVSLAFENAISVHPHWHSEIEILYIVDGRAIQQINEHIFETETGDIIIIGRDQLHSTYSYQSSRCEILAIMFNASDLLDNFVLQVNDNSSEIFMNEILFNHPIKSDSEHGKQLKEIILEIHGELTGKNAAYRCIVKSLLYKMASILIRNKLYKVESSNIRDYKLTRQVLEKTFKLIDESYFEDISLNKAASASNLSTPHFCRLFKKATGMTFNAYLSFYRVNRAERMLDSNNTLTSIAMECGFGSVSSFIRNFKKYKNCTPSEFKRI